MFMAIVVVVPAASAAVGPLAPMPDIIGQPRRRCLEPPGRPATIQREAHRQRRAAIRLAKREGTARVHRFRPHLQPIAQCESHGDPQAIGGGGAYRGKYQFSYSTWAAVGGPGDPAAAPEAEQDRRAAILYARTGPSQWPVCGSERLARPALTALPGTMSSRPSSQRTQALWPPS